MDVIYTLNEQHIHEPHQLYQNEWWTKGRSFEETKRCIDGSAINIGIVDNQDSLRAYTRVLTDYTFKALIFDLIVSRELRNEGLGDRLMTLIKNHNDLQQVKHFELYCLPDLFSFYEKYGFSSNVRDIKLMRLTTA